MLDTKEMTLKQIEEWLIEHNAVCTSCHYPVQKNGLESYPNEHGIEVAGRYCKRWVYTYCKVCGYETVLSTLEHQIDVWKERRRKTHETQRNNVVVGKPQEN